MKNRIRLNESQLQQVIKESVNQVLMNEMNLKQGFNNFVDKVKGGVQGFNQSQTGLQQQSNSSFNSGMSMAYNCLAQIRKLVEAGEDQKYILTCIDRCLQRCEGNARKNVANPERDNMIGKYNKTRGVGRRFTDNDYNQYVAEHPYNDGTSYERWLSQR